MSVLNVVYLQVVVSAKGRSLAQRSPTECGASNEQDNETSRMRRPRLITVLNPAKEIDVCLECCISSGRGLCDGPITHSEESN